MTFQAYIDNIRAKTGKTPDDFHKAAVKAGLLNPDVKAMQIVNWLKAEYGLGHGHAMAIFAVFKDRGWVASPAKGKAGGAKTKKPDTGNPRKAEPAKAKTATKKS